jgi:alpha/beta superfamily hydrolase
MMRMQEEKVRFPSGRSKLGGLYHGGHAEKGVVVTHPHPLYGGDMYSPVVEAIVSAYHRCGYATLRFNFRGAGNSNGVHDRGVGERRDVAAAIDWLVRQGPAQIHLSGYSFGAWVNAMAVQERLPVQQMSMVAPPVAFIDFAHDIRLPALTGVVAGSHDEFAPPALIRPLMEQWHPTARLEIIDGADHFFFGYLGQVTRRLMAFIDAVPNRFARTKKS